MHSSENDRMIGINILRIYFWILSLTLLVVLEATGINGILPEASQEGILRPFRSYSDLTLFHYDVPPEVTQVTWEFAAFTDSSTCPTKEVQIYIQHGSYPIINQNNSSFPPEAYIGRTSLHHVTATASFEPRNTSVFHVPNPIPGSWFAVAFISDWDLHLKQEGLSHKCHYSLGSVALWSQATAVPVINIGAMKEIFTLEPLSYYKIYIPSGTWHFKVNITNCKIRVSSAKIGIGNETIPFCIKSLSLRAKALPFSDISGNITEGGGYLFDNTEPFTECYYYLLVVSAAKVSFNVQVSTEACNLKILGRGNIKRLEHIKESLSASIMNHSESIFEANWSSSTYYPNSTEVNKVGKLPSAQDGDICLPIFQLARIKHSEDFSDTYLLQGHGWFTHWIAMTESSPIVVEMTILPYIDIGGTLSIGIHLDEILVNATKQLLVITACIRKGAVPSRIYGNITCDSDLKLTVTSSGGDTIDATKYIPYPEPDKWYIAFQLKCYFNRSGVPCALEEVMLSLDIQSVRCAFPVNPCGTRGVCQESHKGVHVLTSCYCLGGYTGWGCTDDSKALPQSALLLNTLLLTLSNIFFLPAVILAIRQNMGSEAVIYLATMIFSTLYHACDEDFYGYCVTKYEVLQFCDFFCSILAFWMTLIAMAEIPTHLMSTFQIIGVIIIAVGVEYNRTGLLVFIIPSALGVSVPVFYWCLRSYRKSCRLFKVSSILQMLPGIVLAGTGLAMFAFVETEANYQYVHSAWHVVIALSLLFLLPRGSRKIDHDHRQIEAELYDVNDCSTSSPVFVITSDLDHLLNT